MAAQSESAGAVAVEWAPHTTLYARTLAEHVECARPCDTDMWRYRIFLRSFWLRWADTPADEKFGLVAEEPASLGERWDAFAAGYAQELCRRYQITPPGWVFRSEKYLDHFWFPTLEVQSDYTLLRIVTAPAPWLQEHGVLLWDRELATAQELIEGKGFTVHWRGGNMESFARPAIIEAFEDLARRIRHRHVKAVVYLVGGAAVAMAYDATRTTMDADARIESAHDAVQTAILDIARERGWPSSWMNEQSVYFIPPGVDSGCKTVFVHPSLVVRAASPERLIAMKMLAGRDRDVTDIAVLLPYAKDIHTVDDLVDLMNRLMPEVYIEDEAARDRAEAALRQAGLL